MIPELAAAAAVGLSFSNAWLCVGLSFGTRGDSARVGARFMIGRFIGLMIIGVAISAIGAITEIPPMYFVVIFGAGSIAFGILMLVGIFGGPGPFKRQLRHALGLQRRGDGCRVPGTGFRVPGNDEGMQENPASAVVTRNPAPGTRYPRLPNYRLASSAFLLGVLRGATPCVKLMVLAPLLIAVGPWWALALSFVYALASSAYPLIGFLAASSLAHVPNYERAMKVAGAMLLIFIGFYMTVNEALAYMAPRGD
jgi:cytochrome c biogenesis protein CcdA